MRFGLLTGMSVYLLPLIIHAQQPDMHMMHLFEIRDANTDVSSLSVSASMQMYSYHESISFLVEVQDNDLVLQKDPAYSDYVELILALPKEAFPFQFPYHHHPRTLYSSTLDTAGKVNYRLFNTFPDVYVPGSLARYVQENSLNQKTDGGISLPTSFDLQEAEMPWGYIRIALFADRREAMILNRDQLAFCEKYLGIPLGDLVAGIKYTVDPMENGEGYNITAEIRPEALGLIPVPEIDVLGVAVNIVNTDSPYRRSRRVLSSLPGDRSFDPSGLAMVKLNSPLKTNFTLAPDDFWEEIEDRPWGYFSNKGWVSVHIDVGALQIQREKLSKDLAEISLKAEPVFYTSYFMENIPLERIDMEAQKLGWPEMKISYFRLQGKIYRSQYLQDSINVLANEYFSYPDGSDGFIIRNQYKNLQMDCRSCAEDEISIYRVTPHQEQRILQIRQSTGLNGYCQIGNLNLDDYYVYQRDWIIPGKVIVFRMNHRGYPKLKKRVKVSWNKEGRKMKILDLD